MGRRSGGETRGASVTPPGNAQPDSTVDGVGKRRHCHNHFRGQLTDVLNDTLNIIY